MRTLFLILFSLFSWVCTSQKDSLAVVNTFKKAKALYNQNHLQIKTSYKAILRKHKDSIVQSYDGFVIKEGSYTYSKMGNLETIQEPPYSLTISHGEKMVQFSKQPLPSPGQQLPQIEQILPLFTTYKHEIGPDDTIRCVFEAPKMNALPFTKVEILFGKGYQIKKQTMYMAEAVPYKENGKEKYASTRIEIEFSKFKQGKMESQRHIKEYINIGQNSSNIILKPKLKGYQLIEL